VFGAASKALWQTESPVPQEAVSDFLLLLRRDPNFPYPWVSLGDALAAAGRERNAEYCIHQAANSDAGGDLLLQSGHPKAALPLASEILDQVEKYDSEIFAEYAREVPKISEVLEAGLPPENPRPARAWMRYLTQTGKLPEAHETWRWMRAHGFADAEGVNDYLSFLIAKHRWEEARGLWRE
jgi:hypothetical protein